MGEPSPSYHPAPSAPTLRLPAGACDTHVHVFGPKAVFPFAADAPFRPADAPKETLFALHARLGVERCVIVQSGCHGFDNRVVADAIAARGGAYCGIALAPVDSAEPALKALASQGFRGVRFNFMKHLGAGADIDDVLALARRLEPLGMHLQVHFESSLVHTLGPKLMSSPVPVVIDHMGRIDASRGIEHPDFAALLRLMEDGRFWVKVSGSERASRQGPPYVDAVPFAARLVQDYGDRTLWGTDWPHPNLDHVPDDGILVDLLAAIAPTEAQRQALLVDNPQRLYRFTR